MVADSPIDEEVPDEAEGLIGETVEGYEVLEEISRGGMGVVFKARQVGLNRTVALKLMQGGILAGKKAMMRFRREAEAVAKLDHPNIVPIYEIKEHRGYCYFSMRYIEGLDLGAWAVEVAATEERIAEIMVKVARAVQFAHDRGILHRDLKPQNVLVDSAGEPFLTDFGLAKSEADDSEVTRTGDILGSPSFMAPEQVEGRHDSVDVRTDVYGLGAVMYQLLTGRPPFRGKTSFGVIKQVVEHKPLNPRNLRPGLDEGLVAICLRCLRKAPDRRYESAAALADSLDQWQANAGRPGGGIGALGSWGRRNVGRLAILGVLVICAALLLDFEVGKNPMAKRPLLAPEPDLPNAVTNDVSPASSAFGSLTNTPVRAGDSWPLTTIQVRALLSSTFEIPTEVEDQSKNPIRKGTDSATGLPFEIRERRTGMHFVLIPAGSFAKGELVAEGDEEFDLRRIQQPFYFGKYEVTIAEFDVFAAAENYLTWQQRSGADMHYPFKKSSLANKFSWQELPWEHTSRHPLSMIRHADAEAFLKWMNGSGDARFDVPRETEWEYAARGGDGSPYTWPRNAPDSDQRGNLQDVTFFKATGRRVSSKSHGFGKGRNDGYPYSAPVGNYEANPLGLYDVVGNLREMCRLSRGRWGFRGCSFSSGGSIAPLLTRQTHDPVESSFMLGMRLIWRLPRDFGNRSSGAALDALEESLLRDFLALDTANSPAPSEAEVRHLYPRIAQGYTKPVPGTRTPMLVTRIPRPNFFPLAVSDAKTMRQLADAYAADHPTHFRSAIERYEQVWFHLPAGAAKDELLEVIQNWLTRMDKAAREERERRTARMNELVEAGEYRSAFLVWAELSSQLRTFKDEWAIHDLIEARVPASYRYPVQPGETSPR